MIPRSAKPIVMNTSDRFPWYDGAWLRAFADVRHHLAVHDPVALAQFLAKTDVFRTSPEFSARHLQDVFTPDVMERVRTLTKSLTPSDLELHEAKSFGRWVVHDHPYLTELQREATNRVSALCGEEVEPCYNFLSMYTQLGRCPIHMDTPQAKYTLDICVDQSEPWDIHFSQIVPWPEDGVEGEDWSERVRSDPGLRFEAIALNPGEAVLFSGSSQWHFRDPIPKSGGRSFCDLLFFHYIPKGTAEFVEPTNWPTLFGRPELAELPGLKRLLERAARG